MENQETFRNKREQISQTKDDMGSVISRRQFSLGVSGIVLTGAILESTELNPLSTASAKTSIFSTQSAQQQLLPHAFNRPEYILTETVASIWSPNSQQIATFQKNMVTLYNASTGAPELTYHQHKDEVLAVQWSADSKYLASGGFDQIVHVWDAVRGQTVTMYKGHTDIVRNIAWSPNQHYLASAGYDKTVQVWEALTGRLIATYSGHTAAIYSLTWSPDNRRIASTDLQNKTMIWRVS